MAGGIQDTDILDFYEINPDNERLARQWFSYLNGAGTRARVIVGDGRLELATRQGPHYNLVIVDAFSGDGIPTHLLTVEAVQDYLSVLQTGGVLAFHISNRYYDLRPVLAAVAQELELTGVTLHTTDRPRKHPLDRSGIWVALSPSTDALASLVQTGWHPLADHGHNRRPWTDDYVNLLPVLFATPK